MMSSWIKSLLCHLLAILFVWGMWTSTSPNPVGKGDPYDVTLSEIAFTRGAAESGAIRVKRAEPPGTMDSDGEPPSAAQAPTGTGATTNAAGGPSGVFDPDAYQAELARLLAAHKSVPPEAVRRGLEGMVRLRLTLGAGGRLVDCQVVESSGYELLDQAAVATIQNIGTFPLPHPDSQGVVIRVPIRYQL